MRQTAMSNSSPSSLLHQSTQLHTPCALPTLPNNLPRRPTKPQYLTKRLVPLIHIPQHPLTSLPICELQILATIPNKLLRYVFRYLSVHLLHIIDAVVQQREVHFLRMTGYEAQRLCADD
jgi:hypothetical protein